MSQYPMHDPETIEKVVQFLKDSSEYYSTSVKSRVDAERMFSGDFWTDDLRTQWRRDRRRCEHLSQWGVFESAISSPLTASPWHAQLEDQQEGGDIQEAINDIEADADAKLAFQNCFAKSTDIGANYIIVSVLEDDFTGEPKIVPECAEDPASVALDPCVTRPSARDAEQGAIVNWISEQKAKRLYGAEVLPLNYPQTLPMCYDIGDQWKTRPKKSIPIVTYYERNDQGTVDMIKICGDLVVQKLTLPTTMIPIFRFAAYRVMRNRVVDYIGIVQKTYSLQLGLNLAYSTMLERMNRSPKANFMYPAGAMDGLEEYLQRCCDDDALALIYNPVEGSSPIQLKEAFETGDLSTVIDTTQQLMAAVLGVPPTGIQGSIAGGVDVQRTATEVLEQASNRESNVAQLYAHAYEAMRAVWTCVIEMLHDGQKMKFKLEAGPDIITKNMKRRQELQVMATMLPPELQPIMAKYYADTLSTDDAKMLSKDIVANMDPTIKLVNDSDLDEYAIHEIRAASSVAQQAMDELETTKAENEDLKRQIQSLFTELANKREDRQLRWNEKLLDNQVATARVQIDAAKADADAAIDSQKVELDAQRVAIEAQDKMEQTIQRNDTMLGGM